MQIIFGQTDASFVFFHEYYINFKIIFSVERGQKILQQACNNKVDEYCEKVILFASGCSIILLQRTFKRKE